MFNYCAIITFHKSNNFNIEIIGYAIIVAYRFIRIVLLVSKGEWSFFRCRWLFIYEIVLNFWRHKISSPTPWIACGPGTATYSVGCSWYVALMTHDVYIYNIYSRRRVFRVRVFITIIVSNDPHTRHYCSRSGREPHTEHTHAHIIIYDRRVPTAATRRAFNTHIAT